VGYLVYLVSNACRCFFKLLYTGQATLAFAILKLTFEKNEYNGKTKVVLKLPKLKQSNVVVFTKVGTTTLHEPIIF
jgi:hypothetical protein